MVEIESRRLIATRVVHIVIVLNEEIERPLILFELGRAVDHMNDGFIGVASKRGLRYQRRPFFRARVAEVETIWKPAPDDVERSRKRGNRVELHAPATGQAQFENGQSNPLIRVRLKRGSFISATAFRSFSNCSGLISS